MISELDECAIQTEQSQDRGGGPEAEHRTEAESEHDMTTGSKRRGQLHQ